METFWKLFDGTSGKALRHWPPRGSAPASDTARGEWSSETSAEKHSVLGGIRAQMKQHGVGIYLVMEQDEHQSEYVADCDRRIWFVSQFTGSSAFVSIGTDWAELATDSRYYVIASRQLSHEWELRKLGLPGVDPWDEAVVKRAAELNVDVGVDPLFINGDIASKLQARLATHGRKLVPITKNLVDKVWGSDRPALPSTRIVSHPLSITGEPAGSKLEALRAEMAKQGAKTFVAYSLEEISWVLNLRGGDIPYVPIFKSFLIVTKKAATLYCDQSKLAVDLKDHEGARLSVKDYGKFFDDVSKTEARVWVPGKGSWSLLRALEGGRQFAEPRDVFFDFSPLNLQRAVKNETEISGIRVAQLRCSLSIVQYLSWLNIHLDEGINEYDGGLKLLEFRERLPDFRGNSFETISSVGPNASAPHYAPSPSGSATITRDAVYLLDSGSQFLQGSTDITRTVHFGDPRAEEIRAYTLVLKGQLAVSSFVFPTGTSGWKLDILARQFLWQHGLDYGHGTGHGIGSYLNIHELPLGIGMTNGPESNIVAGHFMSDEPGFYKENEFGVRLENDILATKCFTNADGRDFLTFEVMTLVPYEPKLIDAKLLTPDEKARINAYHEKCWKKLRPHLEEPHEIQWLERVTKKL